MLTLGGSAWAAIDNEQVARDGRTCQCHHALNSDGDQLREEAVNVCAAARSRHARAGPPAPHAQRQVPGDRHPHEIRDPATISPRSLSPAHSAGVADELPDGPRRCLTGDTVGAYALYVDDGAVKFA